MVTKRDDDRQPTDNRQGEYRAICLLKVGRQSFAIRKCCQNILRLSDPVNMRPAALSHSGVSISTLQSLSHFMLIQCGQYRTIDISKGLSGD